MPEPVIHYGLESAHAGRERPDLYFWGAPTPGNHQENDWPRIVIVGAGSLGSAIGWALARSLPHSGCLTRLSIIDDDTVENRNLHNSFYSAEHVGLHKTVAMLGVDYPDEDGDQVNPVAERVETYVIRDNDEEIDTESLSPLIANVLSEAELVILATDDIASRSIAIRCCTNAMIVDCRNALDYTSVYLYNTASRALSRLPAEEHVPGLGCGAKGRMPLTMMTAALASDLALKAYRSYLLCAPPVPDTVLAAGMSGLVNVTAFKERSTYGTLGEYLNLPPDVISAVRAALYETPRGYAGAMCRRFSCSGLSDADPESTPAVFVHHGAGIAVRLLPFPASALPGDGFNFPGEHGLQAFGGYTGTPYCLASLVRMVHLCPALGKVYYDPRIWGPHGSAEFDEVVKEETAGMAREKGHPWADRLRHERNGITKGNPAIPDQPVTATLGGPYAVTGFAVYNGELAQPDARELAQNDVRLGIFEAREIDTPF